LHCFFLLDTILPYGILGKLKIELKVKNEELKMKKRGEKRTRCHFLKVNER